MSNSKLPFVDISVYHHVADDSLTHICDKVEEISESLDLPGFDLKESVCVSLVALILSREVCWKSTWVKKAVTSSTSKHPISNYGFLLQLVDLSDIIGTQNKKLG